MQGKILGSRYLVLEYIAKGGFGKTYLAEDTQLPGKDRCVVKQLYPSVDDPNFIKVARRLFKKEAETLNSLGIHNQIPRLLAYFEEDEKFYLVQQYIEGHTLTKELSGEPWSEAKVIELLKDCLGILNFIHTKGVIHRDVKPDNLIRRQSDNKLVLVDFGTVKEVIDEQTQLVPATVAVGTRGYMPTEQARGIPRITSDIYALGVIAIQALTGMHPIKLEENDHGEIVWQYQAQCSRQLAEIVSKMTRYHFKERYQSTQEILAALAGLNGLEIEVSPTEAVQYTPTMHLSTSQLANMGENHPATSVEPSAVIGDRVVITSPENATSFSAKPPELSKLSTDNSPSSESAKSNLPENESNSMSKTQKTGKTLTTLGIALAVGAIASGGMYFLNQRTEQTTQASIEEQVERLTSMVEKQDYQGCYEEVVNLNAQESLTEAKSMPKEQQQEFEAQCGLGQAKEEANNLNYSAALAIAKTLPQNTSVNAEIQQQIESWSQQLLKQATKLYEQEGKLAEAIEIVQQIPQDSAVRPQVIDAQDSWKAESEKNEAIIHTAEKALSEENWQYAKQQATKVKDSPAMYWQKQAKAIISQAEEGIAATSPAEQSEPVKAIAPAPPPKVVTPVSPAPKVIVPKPEPKPPVTSTPPEQLRDLGSDTYSAPSNNAPLRDL
ncbi:serine/threonine-protein kinase [Pleurocapsa sp. PCC 7319]|uniref:serine/threonine-protein kinase n=1 Tax=Pleurocapsa sp. PCC 7319 TaxID=118161 RepID=UPI00034C4BDD|nr:serine/threonine-protein kinase [Pleurocapsa sp. PCC 7319]